LNIPPLNTIYLNFQYFLYIPILTKKDNTKYNVLSFLLFINYSSYINLWISSVVASKSVTRYHISPIYCPLLFSSFGNLVCSKVLILLVIPYVPNFTISILERLVSTYGKRLSTSSGYLLILTVLPFSNNSLITLLCLSVLS